MAVRDQQKAVRQGVGVTVDPGNYASGSDPDWESALIDTGTGAGGIECGDSSITFPQETVDDRKTVIEQSRNRPRGIDVGRG